MKITLAQAIKRENNNFDLIRLIAAIAVIFGHSFVLFPANGYADPLKLLLVNDYSGTLAVYIFFFLSGIFITSSFISSKTVAHFVTMRVFRIWPALIVCILLTVFLVGIIFTTTDIKSYLTEKQTWKYLIKNIFLIRVEHKLPGVFNHNYFNQSINGSLWTLFTEVRCYLLILIFGLCGLLKRKLTVLLVFITLILCQHTHFFVMFIQTNEGVKQALFFFAGMVAYTYRSHLVINTKISLLLITLCIIVYFINFNVFIYLFYGVLIYTVLAVACSALAKKIKLPGDYSYGIYVYGFLVQQIVAHFFPALTSCVSMAITIPLSILLGVISWYFIESPALKKGKRIRYNKNYS